MPDSAATTSRRDPFLDSWRGIFHIVMLVDHLPFVLPGVFTAIAWLYEVAGYVTVAEGFVFLSGFVSGLVYTRIKQKKGAPAMWRKALARAGGIYVCYVVATVGLVAIVRTFGWSAISWGTWEPLLNEPLGSSFIQVAAFLQQPTFLEILPMYSGLLLITPLLIGQLEKGRAALVLLLSLSIWIAAQYNGRNFLLNLVPFHSHIQLGYFNAMGWQLLFISGLVCGHKTNANGRWLPGGWLLPMVAYMVFCLLLFMRHGWLGEPVSHKWTDRSTVGPLRLLDFYSIVFLVCRFRPRIEKLIAWRGFAFLSRNSLQVFAFHLFPVYIAAIVLMRNKHDLSVPWQLLVVGFSIAGLFVIAFLTNWTRNLQHRLGWTRNASPAKLASDPQ